MDSSGTSSRIAALEEVLGDMSRVAVAVSGGVDSMTLAVVAHRVLADSANMVHAVSPAVPTDATERVERYARRQGWRLERIDAGELVDARYVANPVNRCYFCKTNLYSTIAPLAGTGATIVSGTNTDDLGDFRPGLAAAAEHAVRHPYVECGIGKVRGSGHRNPARPGRSRGAAGRALSVEPGRNRHRDRSRGAEGDRRVRAARAGGDGGGHRAMPRAP